MSSYTLTDLVRARTEASREIAARGLSNLLRAYIGPVERGIMEMTIARLPKTQEGSPCAKIPYGEHRELGPIIDKLIEGCLMPEGYAATRMSDAQWEAVRRKVDLGRN